MNKIGKFLTVSLIFLFAAGAVIYFLDRNNERPIFSESKNDSSLALSGYQQKLVNNQALYDSRKNIITETVKKVSPAVVGITVTEIRQYRDPFGSFFDDPFFRQFFGNRGNNNRKVKSLGSGYIISPDGYILTNDHVAGNATEITVTLTNGKHFPAKLIGSDPVSDICLIKIDSDDLPFVTLGNSDDIMIGEWVIAFGNPFGLFDINDKPTVTVGVVSATDMNLEPINNRYYLNMLQTDAAINGGNSGGPLVNSIGEVIGMNTLIYTAGGAQGSIGLGFAIPINKVKKIVTELKEKGEINRNFDIGLRIQSIDEGIANYYNLTSTKGVIITQVVPKSPASKAGLQVGDLITQVEDYKINNEQTLVGVFQEFRTGQTVNVKIFRDNEELNRKMKLEKTK
ncbi:MAG: trypsin-like peptidase domain-containing protein [Ignavibacteriaceae bacterium]|nr:trypsin-like peptidase domain-containing protein [Ignavibacteriaceae bacterium]